MITHQAAERVAAAIHVLRPDWPVASLLTLITRDLSTWPLTDLVSALGAVAVDQNLDGTWASKTPARVKEDGPWRRSEVTTHTQERNHAELTERRQRALAVQEAIKACQYCDDHGYVGTHRCAHDPEMSRIAREGAARARAALAAARAAREPKEEAE